MIEKLANSFVVFIAKMHSKLLTLNDAYQQNFSDKQLHFLVVGIAGILMLLVVYPIFKALSRNHVLMIAFIYVFTLIIGLSFAIEIGQRISGTGTMDFGDILFGLSGFLLMFAIFAIAREVALALWNILKDIFGRS